MEQDPTNNKNTERLQAENKKRLEALEQALAESNLRAEKYENEWSALFDQHKDIREKNRQLQHDYETLRLQKGGFGFKMLLLSGFAGFVTALILSFVYLKLKPKEPHVVAFRRFQLENQINYELAISQGRFEDVEKSLLFNLERPEYQIIAPEIEFTKSLVSAAKQRCD